MPTKPTTRIWTIDGIEEDTARIEEDGRRILTVPRWLLPAEATEGQVLRVTRSATKGSSTLTFEIDAAAEKTAQAASSAQTEKIAKASKKRDAGGDVAL